MTKDEILKKINLLRIERDEVLGNLASHSLDLSDVFQKTKARYNDLIKSLQDQLKESR